MFSIDSFPRWDLVGMCVALAIVFGFEMLGVFWPKGITITALCRAYIPLWVRGMIIGWLAVHFLIEK